MNPKLETSSSSHPTCLTTWTILSRSKTTSAPNVHSSIPIPIFLLPSKTVLRTTDLPSRPPSTHCVQNAGSSSTKPSQATTPAQAASRLRTSSASGTRPQANGVQPRSGLPSSDQHELAFQPVPELLCWNGRESHEPSRRSSRGARNRQRLLP